MKTILWTVLIAMFLAGAAMAAAQGETPNATGGFDFNLLWKGAVMGGIAAVLRFISKTKNPKEFDFKYLLIYGGIGLLAGAYAAWRGLQFDNVWAFVEGSGLVLVLYTILKSGKEGLPKLVPVVMALIGKKSDPSGPPAP